MNSSAETICAQKNITFPLKDEILIFVSCTASNIDPRLNYTFIGRIENSLNLLKSEKKLSINELLDWLQTSPTISKQYLYYIIVILLLTHVTRYYFK